MQDLTPRGDRYIHTGEAETYWPIVQIVAEGRETNKALKEILARIMT